jgi:hypothetical protein
MLDDEDIPLKVLLVDPDAPAREALSRALKGLPIVIAVDQAQSLKRAAESVEQKEINTIYIDPFALGLESSGDFILGMRRSHPGVVFVLYYDLEAQGSVEDRTFGGERERFRHYFKLDKRTPGPRFVQEVQATVRACQGDLALGLTQEKIISLRRELTSIQAGASEDTAAVPLRILKEIQEQLSARERETKVAASLNRPAPFLGPIASSVKYDRCFLVMPYSEPWSQGVEAVVRESCEAAGVEFTIAKTMEGRHASQDIWFGISGSAIVIADLTGANANVTYELGLADAIGREVIILCQGTQVPFDFLGQRMTVYENSVAGALALRNDLVERLKKAKARQLAALSAPSDTQP